MMLELNDGDSRETMRAIIAHGLDLMQVQSIDKANVLRGQPGQILTAEDAKLIKLEPLRSFAKNEVVAIEGWEEEEAGDYGGDEKQKRGTPPKRRPRRKVYRYAIVEAQEKDSLDALSTLTLITALPGSSSSSISSISSIRADRGQQQQPQRIKKHLSSQVYAFRSELLDSRSLHSSSNGGGAAAGAYGNKQLLPSPFHVDSKDNRIGGDSMLAQSSKDDDKKSGGGAAGVGGGGGDDPAGSNVIEAVSSLLSRVNLPISLSQRALMESNMRLQAEMKKMQKQMAAVCDARDVLNSRLKKIEDSYICHICQSNKVDSVLVPCGHLICSTCQRCLRKRECPFCRNAFRSSAKYFSPLEDGSLS
mmetsp:Transcript_16507/g.23131  ORF Transcript_16507/g.23131 Transcript_16507/m.23131 type:complete len:362 (+) Transcript_16507:400-1485(+)